MANAVEMSTMRKLVAQLNRYRHEYYNLNAPSVADDVYDYMHDELLALEEHTGVCMANSPTQTVGYPVVSALPKVAHDIPLLSLDKTKSIEDLIAFQAGRTVDLSLKLDGLTTELIYENGQLSVTLYLVHSSGKVFLACVGKKMKPNLCRICKSGLIPFIYLRFGYGAGLPSVP